MDVNEAGLKVGDTVVLIKKYVPWAKWLPTLKEGTVGVVVGIFGLAVDVEFTTSKGTLIQYTVSNDTLAKVQIEEEEVEKSTITRTVERKVVRKVKR